MLRIESAFAGRQNLTWLVIAGWDGPGLLERGYGIQSVQCLLYRNAYIGSHRRNKQTTARHVRSEKAHTKKGMHIIVGFMQNRNNNRRIIGMLLDSSFIKKYEATDSPYKFRLPPHIIFALLFSRPLKLYGWAPWCICRIILGGRCQCHGGIYAMERGPT